jgi:hypothetical protein
LCGPQHLVGELVNVRSAFGGGGDRARALSRHEIATIVGVDRVAVRVVLTEIELGSRGVVTCLGALGYDMEVLDPYLLCMTRFSRWVHSVNRCPRAATDPLEYLTVLGRIIEDRSMRCCPLTSRP